MPHKVVNVELKVEDGVQFRLKDKVALLQKISDLPSEDQQRILQLCSNAKALKMLQDNWETLITMIN